MILSVSEKFDRIAAMYTPCVENDAAWIHGIVCPLHAQFLGFWIERWNSRGDMPVISLKTERKAELEENPDSKPMASNVFKLDSPSRIKALACRILYSDRNFTNRVFNMLLKQ